MQFAYTHSNVNLPLFGRDHRHTADIDLQQHFSGFSGHDLSIGASYRRSSTTAQSGLQQRFADALGTLRIASLFAQDEITLSPKFKASLGLRLDDHEFSGLEIQPTARLLWSISSTSSAWIAASRAARTPSQGERNVDFTIAYLPPGIPVSIQGDESVGSETLHQAELGYRAQWTPDFHVDSSVFYHQYRDVRAQRAPVVTANGIVMRLSNEGAFELIGNETSFEWNPSPHWRLNGDYSFHEIFGVRGQRSGSAINRQQLANLNLNWHPEAMLSVNGTLRYVSPRRLITQLGEQYIPSYLAADLALRWQATKMVEFKIVGQDLLDDCHLEYADTTSQQRLSLAGRGAYAHMLYRF
jgi:iron complex outermembrane receptor protein